MNYKLEIVGDIIIYYNIYNVLNLDKMNKLLCYALKSNLLVQDGVTVFLLIWESFGKVGLYQQFICFFGHPSCVEKA